MPCHCFFAEISLWSQIIFGMTIYLLNDFKQVKISALVAISNILRTKGLMDSKIFRFQTDFYRHGVKVKLGVMTKKVIDTHKSF